MIMRLKHFLTVSALFCTVLTMAQGLTSDQLTILNSTTEIGCPVSMLMQGVWCDVISVGVDGDTTSSIMRGTTPFDMPYILRHATNIMMKSHKVNEESIAVQRITQRLTPSGMAHLQIWFNISLADGTRVLDAVRYDARFSDPEFKHLASVNGLHCYALMGDAHCCTTLDRMLENCAECAPCGRQSFTFSVSEWVPTTYFFLSLEPISREEEIVEE